MAVLCPTRLGTQPKPSSVGAVCDAPVRSSSPGSPRAADPAEPEHWTHRSCQPPPQTETATSAGSTVGPATYRPHTEPVGAVVAARWPARRTRHTGIPEKPPNLRTPDRAPLTRTRHPPTREAPLVGSSRPPLTRTFGRGSATMSPPPATNNDSTATSKVAAASPTPAICSSTHERAARHSAAVPVAAATISATANARRPVAWIPTTQAHPPASPLR